MCYDLLTKAWYNLDERYVHKVKTFLLDLFQNHICIPSRPASQTHFPLLFFAMFLFYFYDWQSIQYSLTGRFSICSFLCFLSLSHKLMKLFDKIIESKYSTLCSSASDWEKPKPCILRSLIWLALIIFFIHATSEILIIIYTKFMRIKILKIR